MKTVYVIPTNRDVTRAVHSYARELQWASEKGVLVPLLVVETDDAFTPVNREALNKVRDSSGLEVIHLTTDAQRSYFEALCPGHLRRWLRTFVATDRDYGRAMNKVFLATVSCGAQGFHRRDSDTALLEDYAEGAPRQFGLEVELQMLGKRLSQVGTHVRVRTRPPGDPSILVVGGNYVGEWNLDVKDIVRESFDGVHRLYELLGFPAAAVEEICADAFPAELRLPQEDTATLVTSVNDGLNPDCGNIAVTGLHEVLPALGGPNILAGDYFAFDVATSLGLPSVHHTRAVFHEYTDDRFVPERKRTYWEGVARFADYFTRYGTFFQGGLGEELGLPLDEELPRELGPALAERIRAMARGDLAQRANRVRLIAAEVLRPVDARYADVAAHLDRSAERLIAECADSYAEHASLLEAWPDLVDRAREVDLRDFVPRAVGHGSSGSRCGD
jgi:hypothetical protein